MLDGKVYSYQTTLGDVEYRHKMLKLKHQTLEISSNDLMKRYMAIAMRYKRQLVANNEIKEEFER